MYNVKNVTQIHVQCKKMSHKYMYNVKNVTQIHVQCKKCHTNTCTMQKMSHKYMYNVKNVTQIHVQCQLEAQSSLCHSPVR